MSSCASDSRRAAFRRPGGIGLALLALALLAASAAGQAPGAVVGRVAIEVDGGPGEPGLEAIVGLRAGDPYSLRAADLAVKRIFATNLYSDVSVLRSGTESVELTFRLTRRLTVRSVSIEGEGDWPASRIEAGLETLPPGGEFNAARLPKAVDELRAALRRAGAFEAVVTPAVKRDPAEPAVDIVFEVSAWRVYHVGPVDFEGAPMFPKAELAAQLKIGPGDRYVPAAFEEALGRLAAYFVDLGYRRAEVSLAGETVDAEAGLVTLAVRIVPQEKITIRIQGAEVPVSLVAPIWEERIFEEWGQSEGQARILAYLRERGYLRASVTARLERGENEIRVFYDVEPREKLRIDNVRFEGLRAFTAERLKAEMDIGARVLFFPVVAAGRLFAVARELEIFYRTQGFPEARVDVNLDVAGGTATAVYLVEEGPRQVVDRVVLGGVSRFPEAELRAVLLSRAGGPYSPANVQKDIDEIDAFYRNRGVRGTVVVPDIRPAGEGTYTLLYGVSEGTPVRIGRIVVTGHRVTRVKTILREVLVREGDPAAADLILESKRRLERLGIFAEVNLDEIPGEAGVVSLVVSVREGGRNYVGLGAGLETKSDPRSVALWANSIRPRVTAEYIRANLFGSVAQASLVGQFSLIERRAVAAWEQPYLFGMPMRTQASAWLEAEDRTSFGFDRRGISLNVIKPLSTAVQILGTLSWARTKLTYLGIAESEVDRRLFPYSTSLVSGSVVWDRRDDSINPTRGMFLSAVLEWAYPLFQAESNYQKTFVKYQLYQPLLPRLHFGLTSRLGLGRGRMPIPERFFAGGSNSFRGAEFDRLGPADPDSEMPVGGKALFLVNLELSVPLVGSLPDLAGAVFYDLGNVFASRDDFSLFELRGAVGAGLRYRTPLGPVRLELGWNLDDPSRRAKPLLYFTIGNVF